MKNKIKLYHGDCLEVMKDIADKSIDMILCDLPYGTTDCEWDSVIPLDKLWKEYNRVIKDNGAIVLFGSQPFTSELICSNKDMFRYELIWEKVQGRQPQLCNVMPMKAHENILVFYKDASQYKNEPDKYIELRQYFFNEKQRLGLTYKDINSALGTATTGGGMASHYFNLKFKQWSLPTEEMYKKLQYAFKEGFKKDYKELKERFDQYDSEFGIKYNPQFSEGKAYNKKEQTKVQGNSPIAGFDSFKGLAKENETKRYPLSYMRFKNPKNPVHPTQKPVELLEYLIKTYTNEGETVLDNCMGSGSTGLACLNTNRKFVGIELDDKYFKIAKDRIENTYRELKQKIIK